MLELRMQMLVKCQLYYYYFFYFVTSKEIYCYYLYYNILNFQIILRRIMGMINRVRRRLRSVHTLPGAHKLDPRLQDERTAQSGKYKKIKFPTL